MGIIRTVTGDIAPDELGVCLPHEHLLGMPSGRFQREDRDLILDDLEASTQEAKDLRGTGIDSLVEMTPIDYHRNPTGLKRISQESGLNIICVTGYLKDKFCAPFVEELSIDAIAKQMIIDIQTGIDDTGIKAGVIKASSSLNKITNNEAKVFAAAAITQQETGALISTHTEAGTMVIEQINLLTNLGVKPNRILIGHLDRNMDWDYHRQVADRGVYFGYDQISKHKYYPDADRIDFIAFVSANGYGSQLMLSMDLARRSDFAAYGGKPGHTYFMKNFIPRLHSAGLPEEFINRLIRDNPRNALTINN